MGGTPCKATPNSDKAITIAILGLDNAGKTTTTRVLEKAPVDSVTPTIGYSQSEITHKNEKIKLIDLGGGKTFREAWRHYYDDAYGFVYVLDSSEENRLDENREVLKRLLQEEKVKGKPILILANKQDKAEALDKNTILEDLKIERLVNENQTLCRVELCTAKAISRNGKNSKVDDAIRHGFDWLIKTVYENYDMLHKRVDSDVRKRKENEQKEKRERMERVQKLREEREKEEEEGVENEEDAIKNGFVPINQAVKNAERSSTEKPTKDKSKHKSSKSNSNDENTPNPPKPAPRSMSHNRILNSDDIIDDQDRPRRHSSDLLSQGKESSVSSNNDDNERINSPDDQTTTQRLPRKKKKVIGPGRQRSQGDNLPPLAPSSSASRRDDISQHKGPPIGTPRPQPMVAQWAITSPTPQYPTEKLTTINSDNENDDNHEKEKSKSTKRNSTSRKVSTYDNEEKNEHSKKSHRHKQTNDHDNNSDDNIRRESSAKQKSSARSRNHNDDEDDDDDDENRQKQSSIRKTTSNNSSHRSHSRTKDIIVDDLQ